MREVFAVLARLRKGAIFPGDQPDVHAYDHIDLPEIKPVVTRVNIHSGHCPCCGKRIAGAPPADMPVGSPFGPNDDERPSCSTGQRVVEHGTHEQLLTLGGKYARLSEQSLLETPESEPTMKRSRFPQRATLLAESALKIANALLESTSIGRRASDSRRTDERKKLASLRRSEWNR